VNLLEGARFAARRSGKTLLVFHPGVIISSLPFEWESVPHEEFTLLAPGGTETSEARVRGAKWSGKIRLDRPSRGLSNVATGKAVRVEPATGGLVALTRAAWTCG
jgi:hypothetical protein